MAQATPTSWQADEDRRLRQITITRLLADRIADELEHADQLAHADPLDVEALRGRIGEALTHTLCLVDEVAER